MFLEILNAAAGLNQNKSEILLSGASKTAARLGGIFNTMETAKASASRLRAIGAENAYLRSIQARRLLGQVRTTTAQRGVSGGSTVDILADTAYLEGMDVARASFREESNAAQTEARGISDALEFGLGFHSDLRRYREIQDSFAEVANLKNVVHETVNENPTLVGLQRMNS